MQINRVTHDQEVFNLLLSGDKINYLSVVEIKNKILETGLTDLDQSHIRLRILDHFEREKNI